MTTEVTSLRLLVAEDSQDDFELLVHELRRSGLEVEAARVASAGELRRALEQPWDLVVSDWLMPGFGGRMVLDVLGALHLPTPCIVISGTRGEEPAVEALRAGAVDYLCKDDPRRFVPAMQRAMREARERAESLASMSHQLRTPLDEIIGYAELLHDGGVEPTSPQHRAFLGDILARGRHLLQLVDDVLEQHRPSTTAPSTGAR